MKVHEKHAPALLKKFQPKFCVGLGMSADFAIVCTNFLRLFDCFDHDIADSVSEAERFLSVLEAMFAKACVLMRTDRQTLSAGSTATASSDRGLPSVFRS